MAKRRREDKTVEQNPNDSAVQDKSVTSSDDRYTVFNNSRLAKKLYQRTRCRATRT